MIPLPIHFVLGWASVIATLGLIGFYLPSADQTIGESYLIFFFHFPSAVNCLNLFLAAGVISALYLRRPSGARLDLAAAATIEVGLLACSVTLLTGSIWAKAAWGVFWDVRDPRLMSVAIMWLTYAGYLALRGTIDEPVKRARFSCVVGILAAVNVPLVYYSIQLLGKSSHPMNVSLGERSMILTRWTGAFAFLILYTAYCRLRYRVHLARSEAQQLEAAFARAGI